MKMRKKETQYESGSLSSLVKAIFPSPVYSIQGILRMNVENEKKIVEYFFYIILHDGRKLENHVQRANSKPQRHSFKTPASQDNTLLIIFSVLFGSSFTLIHPSFAFFFFAVFDLVNEKLTSTRRFVKWQNLFEINRYVQLLV